MARFLITILVLFASPLFAFQPELVLQSGHTRPVNAVAISPDNRWLASASQDSTIKIWDLSNGRLLRTLYGHTAKVNALAISHDGQWIASAGDDRTVRLWSMKKGDQAFVLSGHPSSPGAVAFATDDRSMISASGDAAIFWDCTSGRQLRVVQVPQEQKGGRAILSADGRFLLAGGGSGKGGFAALKVIELSSGKDLAKIKTNARSPFASVVFSQNGELIAVRTSEFKKNVNQDSVKIIESRTGNERIKISIPGEGTSQATGALAFSADGKWIAVEGSFQASMSASMHIFDVTTGQHLRSLTTSSFFIPSMNLDLIRFAFNPLVFSQDSQMLALGGANSIQLWETKTGKELFALRTNFKTGALTSTSIDPEMAEALKKSGMSAEFSQQMSADSGNLMDQMTDPDNPMSNIFAMAGQIAGIQGTPGSTKMLAGRKIYFGPDARWLITEQQNRTDVWDFSAGTHIKMPLGQVAPMAISADGRLFASLEVDRKNPNENPTLFIRDTGTFTIRNQTKLNSQPQAIAFAPDGTWVAMAEQNQIRILDTQTGKDVRSFSLQEGVATGRVALSPNGKFVAYGSSSGGSSLFSMPGMMSMSGMSEKQMKEMSKQMSKAFGMATMQPQPAQYDVKIFDVGSGSQLQTLAVEILQPATGTTPQAQVQIMQTPEQREFRFSPDGILLAVEDYDQQFPAIKIYESATGSKVTSIRLSNQPAKATAANDPKTLLETKQHPVFAFSGDHQFLAVSSQQGEYSIKLYDVRNGQIVRNFPHHARVDAIGFSPDHRFLVSLLQDGTRLIWNATSGALLATLVEFPGIHFTTEWLVITPDGLFDGSPGAFYQILWRFSPDTFDVAPVEAFFNELYHPGLLSEIFSGRSPRAPHDFSQLDRRQPIIKLSSSGKETVSERMIPLHIEVMEAPPDAGHSAGSGARDLRLFRNGSMVKVWHGDVLKGASKATLDTTVPVVAGMNRFVAYAFNSANIKSADGALIVRGADNLKRDPKAYILAIGINEYSNPDFNLKFAVPDAQVFGENLRQSLAKARSFATSEVILLTDQEATKGKIMAALQKLKEVQPEDAIFIYYAGHGTVESSHFYFVPQDLGYTGTRDALDAAAMKTILSNSISDQELEHALEEIDAGQILLLIDACNSGQALESDEKRFGMMNSKGLAQLAYEKGMYVLAAAQGYQAALEAAELGHGYLTFTLVEEGLKTAAADQSPQDGQVWVGEWLDYSTLRVPQMQSARTQKSRLLQHEAPAVTELPINDVQRPRVFYRRESFGQPLVIVKP